MTNSSNPAPSLQASPAWAAARAEFYRTGEPAPVHAALTAATDAIVAEAFAAAMGAPGAPATLVALGAYARGLTLPFSSADLLLLCSSEAELEGLKASMAAFVQHLWDRGLQLNCAVRTLDTALGARNDNVQVCLGLLDRRLLGGDASRLARLEEDLPRFLTREGGRLRQELTQAVRARHQRFQLTSHHVVPDVKHGPGGLMDVHALRLLHRIGGRDAPASVAGAERMLNTVRCYMHFTAGRDENRVDSRAQAALARPPFTAAGDGAAEPEAEFEIEREAQAEMQRWRRGYSAAARTVLRALRPELEAAERAGGSLLGAYHDYRSGLSNAEFTVVQDRLYLRHPAQFGAEPERLMELLTFVARHGVGLAADTAARLASARATLEEYCSRPGARWAALAELLPLPHADAALRALEEIALLTVLLPGWEAIEGLAGAPEQRFTADEQTLRSFAALTRLRGPLRAEADPLRLRFAILLAEAGNGAELSAAVLLQAMPHAASIQRALDAMGPSADARARIEFLLQHRQQLEAALGTRDLGDGEQARQLAAVASTIEQLRMLVLLTYSQVAAADEESRSAWRLEQLDHAYRGARSVLTQGLEADRIEQVPAGLPGRPEFVRGFPARYLHSHTRTELEAHARLEASAGAAGVAVQLEATLSAFRLTVIAPDRNGLFASFAGALASFGMNILKAEAYANREGVILDTFVFADPNRMLGNNPAEADRLTDLFRRVALGRTDARKLMRPAPAAAAARRAQPEIRFEDVPSSPTTMVEIHAEDRPGLLYSLASAFSSAGCDIQVVLIDTQGGRAQDVFYVAQQNRPLSGEMQAQLAAALRAACC
ncbi:MAG TPA: hypothetical protein VIC54_07930 [Terriglobales bacterium]|jgi:[protein-PII] uridylyltransferase